MGRARGPQGAAADGVERRGGRRYWTPERLETALCEYIGDGEYFPTAVELEADGRSDIRHALKRLGGHSEWARRLGLPLRPGQDREPYSLEDAVRDARALVAAHGSLPGMRPIRREGYPRLASYIQWRHGGSVSAFVAEHLSD